MGVTDDEMLIKETKLHTHTHTHTHTQEMGDKMIRITSRG